MSAYKGQRGPNVSQYIANLNQLSPQQDLLSDPVPAEDFSDFLNADFLDVNSAQNASVDFNSPTDFDINFGNESTQPSKANAEFPHNPSTGVEANMDFNLNGDFPFTDFNNFGGSTAFDQSMPLSHTQPNHYPIAHNYASPASSLSPIAQGFDQASKKRKLDNVAPVMQQQSLDENARVAAEEDKRRRNTAASARFRIKKKQREQALEQSQKEAQEKVAKLEATIQQLQTENAWLKGLITEKNGGKSTTDELKALINKRENAASERSSSAHTDGVGTKAEKSKVDA